MAAALDRLEVVAKLKLGLTPAEVAKLFGAAESTIEKIAAEAAEKGLLRKTHQQRRAQRKEVADFIAAGGSVAEAAAKFDISETHVRQACSENGVKIPQQPRERSTGKAPSLKIVALLIEGKSHAEIAKQLGSSVQWVGAVATEAREAGIFEAVRRAVKQRTRATREK